MSRPFWTCLTLTSVPLMLFGKNRAVADGQAAVATGYPRRVEADLAIKKKAGAVLQHVGHLRHPVPDPRGAHPCKVKRSSA